MPDPLSPRRAFARLRLLAPLAALAVLFAAASALADDRAPCSSVAEAKQNVAIWGGRELAPRDSAQSAAARRLFADATFGEARGSEAALSLLRYGEAFLVFLDYPRDLARDGLLIDAPLVERIVAGGRPLAPTGQRL